MKRFFLFSGDNYYPSGGWSDFVKDFDTVSEAKSHILQNRADWYEIVDSTDGKVVDCSVHSDWYRKVNSPA
jgi:hypothetical protein